MISKYCIFALNQLWNISLNIQYLFGNYLSYLPINKTYISFCLFFLLLNCMPELIFSKYERVVKYLENLLFKNICCYFTWLRIKHLLVFEESAFNLSIDKN